MEHFYKRIGYKGDIEDISIEICKDYKLGGFVSNDLITIGYEDFNYILETNKGKYFVKVFANFRDDKQCKRYIDVILAADKHGIAIPELYKSDQCHLHILKVRGIKLRLCLMRYINGKNILSLNKRLTPREIRFLARQAAMINSINIKPEFVYDHWAIVNFLTEYKKKSKYLSSEDIEIINPLVKEFQNMKIKELPHCFVHGDIILTNVMKDNDGKLWIIDFAVSNYYPRIQEIAVLACDLLFFKSNFEQASKDLKIVLEEYQKLNKLTKRELEVLPTYIKMANAMVILNASFEKYARGNKSEENEYWLENDRNNLRQIIDKKLLL